MWGIRRLPASASALLIVVTGLIGIGVVILYSTSGMPGVGISTDPGFFLRRQLTWIALGIVAYLAMSRIPYRHLRSLAVPFAGFTVILLVMTIIPGVGVNINGSSRWLRFGPVNFQPSELAKLSCIVAVAWWMANIQRNPRTFRDGLAVPVAILGLFTILILLEPDFGTTMLLGAVGLAVMFVGGARIGYLFLVVLGGTGCLAVLISRDEERLSRLIAFQNPEKYAQGEAFQLLQGLYAFVRGGGFGRGLGESLQKRHYLPEAHTDFIFAILGEELGLRGTLPVILLFLVFFFCGLHIASRVEDRFAKLLAFGITLIITMQAALNIGVVTGSLPTKGITLPFISFGGSSMLISLAMVGILVNIALDMPERGSDPERRLLRSRGFGA